MLKTVTIALALSSVIILTAVCAKAETANTYQDAMRQCGAEWKASEQRAQSEKGKRAAAWQAFRKECTARVGYVTKRAKAN